MNRRAFSLIELLVVIAVVAILSAIAIPSYSAHSARVSVTKSIAVANSVIFDIKKTY